MRCDGLHISGGHHGRQPSAQLDFKFAVGRQNKAGGSATATLSVRSYQPRRSSGSSRRTDPNGSSGSDPARSRKTRQREPGRKERAKNTAEVCATQRAKMNALIASVGPTKSPFGVYSHLII